MSNMPRLALDERTCLWLTLPLCVVAFVAMFWPELRDITVGVDAAGFFTQVLGSFP